MLHEIDFNGVKYPSMSALARAYGIAPTTLRSRLKQMSLQDAVNLGSPNGNDCKYIRYIKDALYDKNNTPNVIPTPATSDLVFRWKKPRSTGESVDKTNPTYYKKGKFECIDVLEELLQGVSGTTAFCLGNCIKYLWRFNQKNGVEDLKKARWYLDKLITNKDIEISEIIDEDTNL